MNCRLRGSSLPGPAREAKWELTAKGRKPLSLREAIKAASSPLREEAREGGSSSAEVIRDKAITGP
jgi:hypothetical protein